MRSESDYFKRRASGRMLLTRSVDLRGNTDDSWSRGLAYWVKNSVLPENIKPTATVGGAGN